MSTVLPIEVFLAGSSPQRVPLLNQITALLGTTANCLQAVNTSQLKTPYMVQLLLGGPPQFWTAKSGTDATDVANGIVAAGDTAQTGIVWYSSNP